MLQQGKYTLINSNFPNADTPTQNAGFAKHLCVNNCSKRVANKYLALLNAKQFKRFCAANKYLTSLKHSTV